MRSKSLLLLLLVIACRKPVVPPESTQNSTSMATTTTTTAAAPTGPRVIFPDGFTVHIELATDDETRAQGLMFRDQLRPATGMLFLFPRDGEYPFWMKNTLIPLDMIWIDQYRHIVHIWHAVPPCKADPCTSYPPNATARYVLEVAGGVAKQHGLKNGDVLRMEDVDSAVVR